jgi:hypothetical protein
MSGWDIQTPYAKVVFAKSSEGYAEVIKELGKLAGCRCKGSAWLIPQNALSTVSALCQRLNVQFSSVAWDKAPNAPIQNWADIESALRASGEVRPEILDNFLLQYQKEALNFAWTRDGVHLWHPTGCVEGRARLRVRITKDQVILSESVLQIAELYLLFNRAEEGTAFLTRSRRDDGSVFWNEIRRVYACGMKDLLVVGANGRNVTVSTEHQFAVRDPVELDVVYKSALDLKLTDSVVMCLRSLSPDATATAEAEERYTHTTEYQKVDRLERKGAHHTYDMTMADEMCGGVNNYILEDFVTHNSGKTLTGVLAALSVSGPMLVVTRAASRIQYAREIERFTTLRPYVIRPSSELRKNSQSLDVYLGLCLEKKLRPVVIVGWESLNDHMDKVKYINPSVVIYDESHRGKNGKRWDLVHLADLPADPTVAEEQERKEKAEAKAKGGFIKVSEDGRKMLLPHVSTASAAALIARLVRTRICTTATPVKNRINDLWAQLDLAEPNAWGSVSLWQDRYCDRKPGKYGGFDVSGQSNIEELNERIKGVAHILSQYETHRDLPAKRRQSFYIAPEDQCRPTPGFAKEHKEAQSRGPAAVLESRLAEAASRKRKAVLSLIEDHINSNHKVVVFTARKADCDNLGEDVKKLDAIKNNGFKVWCAHGELDVKSRQKIVDAYMASESACVLIATGQAFGESLNLQDTDAAIFVMLPYDPGNFKQWEGRFSRQGQKRPVTIYYVIAVGTVDEHVASILIDKMPAVEKVAKDSELAAAETFLAGTDPTQTAEEFAQSVLSGLDFD